MVVITFTGRSIGFISIDIFGSTVLNSDLIAFITFLVFFKKASLREL